MSLGNIASGSFLEVPESTHIVEVEMNTPVLVVVLVLLLAMVCLMVFRAGFEDYYAGQGSKPQTIHEAFPFRELYGAGYSLAARTDKRRKSS